MKKISIICLCIFLTMTGCTVGPDYMKPDMPLPAEFKGNKDWKVAEPQDHLPKGRWWRIFNDPLLNQLEEQAAAANQELKAAAARVEQARAIAGLARSEKFPFVNMNPSARRSRAFITENQFSTYNIFSLPFDLSYEIDLWGRVRRSDEAAQADAEAVIADFGNALLSLQADLARNYFQLRTLDTEIGIVKRTEKLRQESLKLVQSRVTHGYISELDLERARTELASTRAEAAALRKTRGELENAIAVLLGKFASDFSIAPAPLRTKVPGPLPSLPSELLERRPDIARAERNMASANAKIGVAKAAFFPTVRLTGSAGYQNSEAGSLLDWSSRVWSLGPGVSLPLFTGGRNRANLEKSEAVYDESLARYRQTVLLAFQEVEDGLAGLRHLEKQAEALAQAVRAAGAARTISEKQYRAGMVSYLDVVDAQRTALQAERAATQISGLQLTTGVKLIKALGGGWEAD